MAVAPAHPGCCLGNLWQSQNLASGRCHFSTATLHKKRSAWGSWLSCARAEVMKSFRSRWSELCVSWITSALCPPVVCCVMLCNMCDICLGFHICAKDYLCFPYAGDIKVLNELIIWLHLLFVCTLWCNFRFNSALCYVWICKLTSIHLIFCESSGQGFEIKELWLLCMAARHCLAKWRKRVNMTWSFICQVCHAAFN